MNSADARPPRPGFWHDRHCVVTGASSGLGKALARLAAARGARVGLVARRESLLQEAVAAIAAAGGTAACAVADVSDRRQVAEAVRRLEERLGPCDVAIANAGLYRLTDGAAFDADRAERVIATNVIGVTNLLGAVLPGMVARRRGHVCGISSIGSFLPLRGSGAYGGSKAAVNALLRGVRLDVEPHGVVVTIVQPGFIDTAMITEEERRHTRGLLTAEEAGRRILEAIERGRREAAFPASLALACRLAALLPWPIYRRIMRKVPPLAET